MDLDFPEPSVITLWQARTSGMVLLVDGGTDGGWCTVNGRSTGFAGLFDPQEAGRRIARARLVQTLWASDHGWSRAARDWAVAYVQALPVDALHRTAGMVFPASCLADHLDDGLLAYAWWGHLPEVFDALRDRGLTVEDCRWAGRPLQHWLDDARTRPEAPQHRWACEMLAHREQHLLRGLTGAMVGGHDPRILRRL